MEFARTATLLAATAMLLTTTVLASAQDAAPVPENNGPRLLPIIFSTAGCNCRWAATGAVSAITIDRDGKRLPGVLLSR